MTQNSLNVCDVAKEIVQRYSSLGDFYCFSQSQKLINVIGQTFC